MSTERNAERNELARLVETQILKVNATFLGIVTGLAAGLALFMATNWLVLMAKVPADVPPGHHVVVGPNLALLGQYFIGYRVSFLGSLIGFAWAFVTAFVLVYGGARFYNAVAGILHARSRRR